jgi:hypothetical protein
VDGTALAAQNDPNAVADSEEKAETEALRSLGHTPEQLR